MRRARLRDIGRARRGMTLVEVIVALGILGGVLLALGMFTARLSRSTSTARIRVVAAQLAADRLEQAKGAVRYSFIDTLVVGTEATITNYPNFKRQTWVTRVGGAITDTIDYKVVTVQVTNSQLPGQIRRTTVIAPF